MRAWSLGFLAWLVLRILCWTWRVRVVEPQALAQALKFKQPLVFAHWHRDELALLAVSQRYRICSLVSTSHDGQMMAVILKLFGVKTTRGSSTRGGISGYLSLIKLIKRTSRNGSFAVDGPKGPIFKVKPGVLKLAAHLEAPIFYPGVAVSRAWRFPKSWNQAYLPKPFSKILIEWHAFSPVKSRETKDQIDELAAELSNRMRMAQSFAENALS